MRHVTDLTHYTYPPSAGMAPKFEAVFPKPEKPENMILKLFKVLVTFSQQGKKGLILFIVMGINCYSLPL